MKKYKGFTLMEMVIVIVLMGIIAVVSSKMLATGLSAYLTGKNVIDAGSQARLAMERMVRDIRSIRSPADLTTASSTQLVFTNMSGTTITYALSGTTLTRNSDVLADGISSLGFTYFDKDGGSGPSTINIRYITISITVSQGNTNFSVTTSVNPRNSS